MSKLLVSVRDVAEARIALEAGVDLIDLKEPMRGSLGRVDDGVVRDVEELIAGRVPLSVALGELREKSTPALHRSPTIPHGVAYAKLGLAGCAGLAIWRADYQAVVAELPPGVGFVAVTYADAELCGAPPPSDVIDAAVVCRARAVLVDTAIKNGRDLFAWWSGERLRRFVAAVREQGMLAVVGGGLTLETIPQVAACGPDYVAVRGAACDEERTGKVSPDRIAAIRALL